MSTQPPFEPPASAAAAGSGAHPPQAPGGPELGPEAADARALFDEFAHGGRTGGEAGDHVVDRGDVLLDGFTSLSKWCLRALIVGIACFAGWKLLGSFAQALVPLGLALLVASVLWYPARWLRAHHFSAGLAAATTVLGFFLTIVALVIVVAPNATQQAQTLYYQAFEGVQKMQLWLQGPPLNLRDDDVDHWFASAINWLQARSGLIAGRVFSGLSLASSVMINLMIVVVLLFFFLKDGDRFLPWLRHLTGRRAGWHLTEVLTRAWLTLSGFFRAQAVVSLVDAVFIGLGLVALGIPMWLALATLTFLAGFIPIVGAVVAGAVAVLVAFVSHGLSHALGVLVVVLVVQQLEGNVLSPMLQSKAMNLHPVVVLISVTVGGSQFGIAGAFFAVPVAATIAVVIRCISDLVALRAGELKAEDIAFVTVHGKLTGEHREAEGKRLRAERFFRARPSLWPRKE